METPLFANISQRAIATYQKALATAAEDDAEPGQAALRGFLDALYRQMADQPALFGLPVTADTAIMADERDEKEKKQLVKRLLDRPRDLVARGLKFLQLAGLHGQMDGAALVLEGYAARLKESKAGKPFMQGLPGAGLALNVSGDAARLESPAWPGMLPALQDLARRCAAHTDEYLAGFLLAAGDFHTAPGEMPRPANLYRYFEGADEQRVLQLHAYFMGRGYKTEVEIVGPYNWVVKYQGERKVKSTPLFQVQYDDRYAWPLRMQIKCASVGRIAPLLPQQTPALQADFWQRTFPCRGDDCGWCRNKTTLGPTRLEYNGEARTACWYSIPEVHRLDEQAVALIEQYEQMHAGLAPEK
jgi:hypothetical protein